MDKQSIYLQEQSKNIEIIENQYEMSMPLNKDKKLSTHVFLRKIKEIIFCHKNGISTEKQEKILREYRDYDISCK